jgi:hypothetical protein
MKTITIKQPYASLIINGYKEYEFRSWKTKYRGDLLIHAGKKIDKEMLNKVKHLNLEYPTGCIIGMVRLDDCLTVDNLLLDIFNTNLLIYGNKSDYGGYAWKLTNVKKFDNTIAVNGKLSLWEYNIKTDTL